MPINHREIVSDIKEHIQKIGGTCDEWWVGTAKDSHSPFFESHRVAELNDGFIYREAYTPTGAQEARDCLVNECGLHLDFEDAAEPGRIVFVYHKQGIGNTQQMTGQKKAQTGSPSDHPAFPRRAA